MVKRIVGIVILVIVILAVGFGLRYREELKLLKYMGSDAEEIQAQQEQLKEEQDALRETYGIPEFAVSEEDLAAIASGERTVEEVAAEILASGGQTASGGAQAEQTGEAAQQTGQSNEAGKTGSQNSGSGQGASGQAGGSQSGNGQSADQAQIQSLLTQVYTLQASFTSQVDGLIAEMKHEFYSGEQSSARKMEIVRSKMSQVSAMEKSCDQQMASIVSSLKALDPDLGSQVEQQYESAKQAKKASLIAQYA